MSVYLSIYQYSSSNIDNSSMLYNSVLVNAVGKKNPMISLDFGYRSLNRLFSWFPFFNFLKLESFQALFLLTMCRYSLQSLWQSKSKKDQPFQALVWTDCLNLPPDCQRGMQVACLPSARMPLNNRTLPLGFEIRAPGTPQIITEQTLRDHK